MLAHLGQEVTDATTRWVAVAHARTAEACATPVGGGRSLSSVAERGRGFQTGSSRCQCGDWSPEVRSLQESLPERGTCARETPEYRLLRASIGSVAGGSAMLWCALMTLMAGLAAADPLPQVDWNSVQYQLVESNPKPGQVPMQEYLVVQTLDKLGFSYEKAGSTFESVMYKKYGPECSKHVLRTMRNTIRCVKQQLDLEKIASLGTGQLQALQSGNPASLMCSLVNLDGVVACAEELQTNGKLACTRDNIIVNEARTIAAGARAARHLCRDDGALFGRGLLQLQTCPAEPFQRYSSGMADCMQHFQRLMDEQQLHLGTSQPAMITDSLTAVQNVTQSCPALVRLAQCLPPALDHCSPVMREVATDALREVVFRGLCVDSMDEAAVIEAVDEFGRLNYYRSAGSGSAMARLEMLPAMWALATTVVVLRRGWRWSYSGNNWLKGGTRLKKSCCERQEDVSARIRREFCSAEETSGNRWCFELVSWGRPDTGDVETAEGDSGVRRSQKSVSVNESSRRPVKHYEVLPGIHWWTVDCGLGLIILESLVSLPLQVLCLFLYLQYP